MELVVEHRGSALLLRPCGRLDAVTAPVFEKRALEAVGQGAPRLVIDLAGLEYVSSAGLRSFLVLSKKVQAGGGAVALCSLDGLVAEVFRISGFLTLFPVGATPEEALALVGG